MKTGIRIQGAPWRVGGPALMALLLGGCLTDREVGRSAVVAAPVWFAAGSVALGILWLLWRRARPGLRFTPWPSVIAGVALIAMAAWSWSAMTLEEREYWNSAGSWYVLLGTGAYSLLLLLVWWFWSSISRHAAFAYAHMPVLGVLVLPALGMATGRTEDWNELYLPLIVALAGYGFLPLIVFGAMVFEAFQATRQR